MLSTRSARLAAILLVALLAGWMVRRHRQEHAVPALVPKAALKPSPEKSAKNSFPEE